MMIKLFKNMVVFSLFISPVAFAQNAPVVSIAPPTSNSSGSINNNAQPPLTMDQRLAVLERQLSAMNQIDLVNQVNHLEQQVQDLQGQVQVLSHSLQTVQTQTTSQYADIDKRLQQKSGSDKDNNSATTPADPNQAITSEDSTSSEKALYDSAYKNIKAQKNTEAMLGFKKYLVKYPTGDHAVDAHYWLGQIYILKGDDVSVQHAITEFNTVIKKYPDSDKAKESSLKLGFAYLLQNKTKEAKAQFRKILKDYPGTSTAQLAEARLAQLS